MCTNINPFDILSGKVVRNCRGTFWFKDCGYNNVDENGVPKRSHLHRLDGPAAIWIKTWRSESPEFKEWFIDGMEYTEYHFNTRVRDGRRQRNKPI